VKNAGFIQPFILWIHPEIVDAISGFALTALAIVLSADGCAADEMEAMATKRATMSASFTFLSLLAFIYLFPLF
jgi:hypothetical protein